MLTPDEEVRLATNAARRLAARWGRPHEWRDMLSAAWERVRADNRRGVAARHLPAAACRAVIDQLRVERPADDGRVRKGRRAVLICGHRVVRESTGHGQSREATIFDRVAGPDPRPSPDAIRWQAWEDARYIRAGLPPRARVYLYLWLVEGWTFAEIAAVWGLTQSAVSYTLRGVMP